VTFPAWPAALVVATGQNKMPPEISARFGKMDRGSQANQGDLFDARRDFGSMPCSQREIEECAATDACHSPNRLQRRRGKSSSSAAFACDHLTQADQFRRCGGATFSHCLRRSLPERRTVGTTQVFPVARHRPAHTARTRSCATGCEGRSNKEIAQNACLSLPTVKKHLHSVFRKLAVSVAADLSPSQYGALQRAACLTP
jgi:DNA-binding CsgD family transcriptional regulator